MSRHEADREDLLREATALVERVELTLPGSEDEPLVVGYRRDGSASFFFGADPVYQFNSAGELRRAFVGGRLIKAESGRLVALQRMRGERQIELQRHDLGAAETALLLTDVSQRLTELRAEIDANGVAIVGSVPADADVLGRVSRWLAASSPTIRVAKSPHAR